MDTLPEILRAAGDRIYDFFVLPGQVFMTQMNTHAPNLAASLNAGTGQETSLLPLVISILAWTMAALLLSGLIRLLRKLARFVADTFGTISFRVSITRKIFRNRLARVFDLLFFWRRSGDVQVIDEIQLDELDLAVLRCAKARGPGYALSAPELADEFTLQPAQVQRSLKKLSKNKLLDYVLGTTDGFGNYRLNETGAHFLTVWQRQESGA